MNKPAARDEFDYFLLMKLIRFRRGDEIIVFSENILGSKSPVRIDPVEIFKKGLIKEDDIFYFRDLNGIDYSNVKCKVLNKRGPSHSFMIRIDDLDDIKNIDLPDKWNDGILRFKKNQPIPTSVMSIV